MTELDSVTNTYEKQVSEIKEKCQKARDSLAEMNFLGTPFVSAKLFKEVFDNRFSYFIHDIRLMNLSEGESDERLQFMVSFEDNENEFVYLGAK